MKFRFTISKKLFLGYTILLVLVFASSLLTYFVLNKNRDITERQTKVYAPSLYHMNQLLVEINNSKMLIRNWVFIDRQEDTPAKIQLKELHNVRYPELKNELLKLSQEWDESDRLEFEELTYAIEDTLFVLHKQIMTELSDFEDYNDGTKIMLMTMLVEEGGDVTVATDNILQKMNVLLNDFRDKEKKGIKELLASFNSFQNDIKLTGLFLLLAGIIIALLTIRNIVTPINYLKEILIQMSKGILPEKAIKIQNDEIGEMSAALNKHIQSLRLTSEFAKEIGEGRFDTDFKPLSNNDILGNALLEMRKNLMEANEKEQERKKEDEQRNWVTRGLAMFGDILRKNNDDINELSYDIISNLVKYLNANQGGVFIAGDDDDKSEKPALNMTAAFAYDRRKYADKVIRYGEGLIGACFIEKHSVYMSEIPDTYLNITSGLGKANPKYLLLVPLMVNERVYGVIEVASFYKIEKYQIEFTEKVAESIATTIASVKINTRTARLLEESKQQGEQLIQQEEEMRQNLEELQATQEESHRKVQELQDELNEINDYMGIVELSFEGEILSVNDFFAENLGYATYQLEGENIKMLYSDNSYKKFLGYSHSFESGKRINETQTYETKVGLIRGVQAYIPKRNDSGEFETVMLFFMKE